MTSKYYITQKFENSDYKPEYITETQSVLDDLTLEYTTKEIQRIAPLDEKQLAAARSNLNYRRAALVAEHLSSLGLSTSVSLDAITITLNDDASFVKSEG
jgi:hypothetical protein